MLFFILFIQVLSKMLGKIEAKVALILVLVTISSGLQMDTLQAWTYSCPDGRRIIKAKNSSLESIYSYDPMLDGKLTVIDLKILQSFAFDTSIGFGSLNAKNANMQYWIGMHSQSFAWYLRKDVGRCYGNNRILYGSQPVVGDILTIKLDLRSSAGQVEYLINNQSQGIAFIGVKRFSPLYFGLHFDNSGDAVQILNVSIND